MYFLKASSDSRLGRRGHLSLGEVGNSHCKRMWKQDTWHLGCIIPITHPDLLPWNVCGHILYRASGTRLGSQSKKLLQTEMRVGGEGAFVKEGLRMPHSYHGNELLKSSQAITQVTLPVGQASLSKGCQESSPARFVTLNKCQERCWLVPSSQQRMCLLAQRCFVLFG